MKTIIKTTLKGSEAIQVNEKVEDVYELLMDKGGFCLLNRVNSKGEKTKMVIKKSVVKLVIVRE